MLVLIQTGIVPVRTRVIKGKETSQAARSGRMLKTCGTSLPRNKVPPASSQARDASLLTVHLNSPEDVAAKPSIRATGIPRMISV
jgi:hypothetical protein